MLNMKVPPPPGTTNYQVMREFIKHKSQGDERPSYFIFIGPKCRIPVEFFDFYIISVFPPIEADSDKAISKTL
jgi:hypothetical protein